MTSRPQITRVRLQRASNAQQAQGLAGWISFVLDGQLMVSGLALRRSATDRYVFVWPARKDGAGRLHHHLRPVDDEARRAVEGELLAQLFPLIQERAL